jgi:hypothetical protein
MHPDETPDRPPPTGSTAYTVAADARPIRCGGCGYLVWPPCRVCDARGWRALGRNSPEQLAFAQLADCFLSRNQQPSEPRTPNP